MKVGVLTKIRQGKIIKKGKSIILMIIFKFTCREDFNNVDLNILLFINEFSI
tara:strand:- start:792 stop:947 length:156 start_codon:yes stop_codon:yes gene_type:complete